MKHFKANEPKPCTKQRAAAKAFLSAFVRVHVSAVLSAPPTLQIKQRSKFARLVFYEKAAASHAVNSFKANVLMLFGQIGYCCSHKLLSCSPQVLMSH